MGDNFIIAQGLFHAIDNGADVINLSLGSTYKSEVIEDAVAEASVAGVVMVAAAGNRNLNGDEGPGNDNPAREWPALMREVIGVTALDASDIKSPFSNYGSDVNLSAPGSGGIFSSIPETNDGYNYAEWEGTSFATAIVAGAAALLVEANPNWPTAARDEFVAAALGQSAVDVDDRNPQYEQRLGDGRLDLIAALDITPAELVVTAVQVVTGQHIAGGLLEVSDSDDRYLQVRSSLGRTIAQPHLMELRIDAATPDPALPAMLIEIETRVDEPGASGRLFLRDWTSGALVQVGSYAPTQTDRIFAFNIIDPPRFVSPGGEVEIRMRHVVVVPFLAFQFGSFVDELNLDAD